MSQPTDRSPARGFVVLGAPIALWAGHEPSPSDAFVLMEVPIAELQAPGSNTVLVSWTLPTQVYASVRTLAGSARGSWLVDRAEVFDGLALSTGLAERVQAETGLDVFGAIPLGFVHEQANEEGGILRTHSQTAFLERVSLFVRTGEALAADADPLCVLLEAHQRVADRVNNPEWAYQRVFRGLEMEVKFTFDHGLDIYAGATGVLRRLRAGDLSGFVEHPVKAFWPSERRTRMLEIRGPGEERGYISFTDTPESNVYIEKVKKFHQEALLREERVTKGVVVPDATQGGFERYVQDTHGFETIDLGAFRRTRYDIDFESLETGNVYGMMFDHCVVEHAPDHALLQCEIEYLESRTLGEVDQDRVARQLDEIVEWLRGHFGELGLSFDVGFHSKLAFMRGARELEALS